MTNLHSQIDSITTPDYTDEISNLNDSILNLPSQIDSIMVPNYTSEISNFQSQIDIHHINCMRLKGQLGTSFTNINSIQDKLNHLIIRPDYTADINNLNDSITGLFERLLPLDEVNFLHIIG
jgi:hypothetical protein